MLDGFAVDVGNIVWDILMGQAGQVAAVSPTSVTVDFGGGRTLTYFGNGEVAGRRRLYWRNPVLTLPEKNDSQWQLLQAVVDTIRANP
jgi:hypothetical protein